MRSKTLSASTLSAEKGTIRGGSFPSFHALREAMMNYVLYSGRVPVH